MKLSELLPIDRYVPKGGANPLKRKAYLYIACLAALVAITIWSKL